MQLKLMTANVWADVFGNPVPGRDTALARMIIRRHPDVVFFQEMHPHWWTSQLSPMLHCDGYRRVEPDLGRGKLNYTPLYYDVLRLEALSNGFHLYTGPNDYDSKSVTWALLRERTTGKVFGAMATHLYFAANEMGNRARLQNVKELIGCAADVRAAAEAAGVEPSVAAEMPVFCGGDYNCDLLSQPFAYLEAQGMHCASRLAAEKVNFICTWHENPVYDPVRNTFHSVPSTQDNVYSIDHICVQGKAAVDRYEVITDPETFMVSDHCAVEITARV